MHIASYLWNRNYYSVASYNGVNTVVAVVVNSIAGSRSVACVTAVVNAAIAVVGIRICNRVSHNARVGSCARAGIGSITRIE